MEKTISIVIPTRNRDYTLEKVLESYFIQKHIIEIIVIDDCGSDSTNEVVSKFRSQFPSIDVKYERHSVRGGASAARITGYKLATGDFVLFGEDDAYLENNYTEILLKKILNNEKNIVSGRIIYKNHLESNEDAKLRFGIGTVRKTPFHKWSFTINPNAIFEGDIELPLTHALFLASRKQLLELGYDPYYSKGNGYREESDFQINSFCKGSSIIVTNETHCFHMHRSEVNRGGQRANRFKQLYWQIFYTNYFYKKYFKSLNKKLNFNCSRTNAILIFSTWSFYNLFIKPFFKIISYLKTKR